MSTPFAISGFNGEYWSKASDAKLAGRMLEYKSSAFRSRRIPCSGRTGPTPHLGPPTAPTRGQIIVHNQNHQSLGLSVKQGRTEKNSISLLTALQGVFG